MSGAVVVVSDAVVVSCAVVVSNHSHIGMSHNSQCVPASVVWHQGLGSGH